MEGWGELTGASSDPTPPISLDAVQWIPGVLFGEGFFPKVLEAPLGIPHIDALGPAGIFWGRGGGCPLGIDPENGILRQISVSARDCERGHQLGPGRGPEPGDSEMQLIHRKRRDLSPGTPAELLCWSESPGRQLLPCRLRSMAQHPKCNSSCCPLDGLLCDSTNIIFRFWSQTVT